MINENKPDLKDIGIFTPEEMGIVGNIGKWRNDRFTRFLRWWLCRGVWNSEPPLHVDPRELNDRVGQLILAQKMLDGISTNSGLTVRGLVPLDD